jgi:hypothetical protein
MKIDELIEKLKEFRELYGNVSVMFEDPQGYYEGTINSVHGSPLEVYVSSDHN